MNPFKLKVLKLLLARSLGGLALLTATQLVHSAPNDPLPATPVDPYCTVGPEALRFMPESTRQMASLLEKLARESDPAKNAFLNRQGAELLMRQFAGLTNSAEAIQTGFLAAMELLNAGETQSAIDQFAEVQKLTARTSRGVGSSFLADLRRYTAVAYLRLGEQENCLSNHNAQSCILPITGEGVHKVQRGSRKAIEVLQEHLNRSSHDAVGKWLLNLAYMTVGEYPDKVPEAFRISPSVFASDYDIKRFPDIAGHLGLDVNDLAGGTITEDFDGDGNLDIVTSDWALRGPMHFFRNNGDGTFTDRTMEAGLAGLVGGLNLIHGDYNNDGLPDVLVLRGGWLGEQGRIPDSLLRNDGKGHFTDVTKEAGLLAFYPNQTAVWFDFNGDGWLDLYFGYESSGEARHSCELYRNNRNGTFTECAGAAGVAVVGFVKAVVAGDFNNDGRPDLYLSRLRQPNILFRNDGPRDPGRGSAGDWKFTDVSIAAGVTEPSVSFPAWFFDYDNDGWQDIFVSGYTVKDVGEIAADYLGQARSGERPRLYHNNRDGTFTDLTKEAHLDHIFLTMGSNFGDFDNDGWLDFYLGTGNPDLSMLIPNRAFRNAEGKFFQDVTTSGGFGHLQKGHGVSFADLDNDGDQDIYHSVGGAYEGDVYRNALFENPGHGNHWITLKLDGVTSNRSAIGARIKVLVRTLAGERAIYKTVGTGGSFGASTLRQEIGLGQAQAIERVEIFWPATGKTQTVAHPDMDRFYRVREGDEKADVLKISPFKFAKGAKAQPHQHEQSSRLQLQR